MGRLFALADLHLPSTRAKTMDIFGACWRDHVRAMATAWDARVAAEDAVLLPGDLSWAESLEEALADLAWIGARPGTKYLLRGNHDSWWSGIAKVRSALPAGCHALQHDAFELDAVVLVGARGWTAPEDPIATAEDAAVFRRELERLRLSIADADRRFGRSKRRVAMAHFPPWIEGRAPTEVVPLLREGGVGCCVYGHLHGSDHGKGVQGLREGIEFYLVAADAVGFAPVPLAV